MKTPILCVAVAVTLFACSASMVSPPGGAATMKNAPVNEQARPGVVRYLNEGAGSVKKRRRQDAYNKMQKACGGPYVIDSESEKEDGGSTTLITPVKQGVMAETSTSKYWYIAFHCLKAQ